MKIFKIPRKIFVFGNLDLLEDSLPLRILSQLREKFPEIDFVTVDPNEDWDLPSQCRNCLPVEDARSQLCPGITIIDTAVGIKDVTVFDGLEKFSAPPRVGMHDFDALTNLRLLWKLGKIKKIKIIATPPDMGESKAAEKITEILEKM